VTSEEFAEFYETHARGLRSYLRRSSGNEALAEDLMQEAFIRLLNTESVAAETRRAYLYRIATNLMIDESRAKQRRLGWIREMIWPSGIKADDGQLRSDMERVFAKLSARERSLLWLAYVEGWSHEEIGRTLGLGASSVKVMIHRAKLKLQTKLREVGLALTGAL